MPPSARLLTPARFDVPAATIPRAARNPRLACALLLGFVGSAAAQDDYRHLVETYANGDRYGPVRELGRHDRARLKDGVEALLTELRARVPDPGSRWPQRSQAERERLLEAGALLHTDRAWLDLREGHELASDEHTRWAWSYVLVVDDLADPTTALLSFARRWYLLQGLRGQGRLDAAHVRHFLGEGLRRFPDDPPLLLALGSLEETLARFDLMRAGVEDPAGPQLESFRGPQRALVERHVLLKRAEAAYRRALGRDPGLDEARLRLGRVLHLLERVEEAEQELRRVARESREPELLYLAHLFLGRLRQDQADLEAADVEYRAAAASAPRSQTAHLALSQVLDRLGDREGALQALEIGLRKGHAEPSTLDGWWAYLYGQARHAEPLVEELRRETSP